MASNLQLLSHKPHSTPSRLDRVTYATFPVIKKRCPYVQHRKFVSAIKQTRFCTWQIRQYAIKGIYSFGITESGSWQSSPWNTCCYRPVAKMPVIWSHLWAGSWRGVSNNWNYRLSYSQSIYWGSTQSVYFLNLVYHNRQKGVCVPVLKLDKTSPS